MKQNTLGIISFIFGIIGIVFSCILIGIIPSIIGLILGIIALNQKGTKKDMSIVGTVCSSVGIALFVSFIIFYVLASNSTSNETESVDNKESYAYEETTYVQTSESLEEKEEIVSTPVPTQTPTATSTPTQTPETTTTPTPEMTDDEKFIADFAAVSDEETANAVFDILRNQIGFSKVKFDEQLGDSSNYSISLDGTYGCVTAMDGYYRVFIPHTDYVFYEDGEVKMTAAEFAGTQMSYNEMVVYYDMAKEAVEKKLKNPKSADFPSIVTHASDIAMEKSGDVVAVQSYVDAKNSFNAVVRSKWTVQFRVTDMSTYSYELLYINIDGEKSGTYIEMD